MIAALANVASQRYILIRISEYVRDSRENEGG